VKGIKGLPTVAITGVPLVLSNTVVPSDATNRVIVWSVDDLGTTGAVIDSGVLTTTAAGTAVLLATVANGVAVGENMRLYIYITVTDLPGDTTLDVTGNVEIDPEDGTLTLPKGGTLTLPDAGATKIVLPADTKIDPETGLITLPANETAVVTTPNNTEIKISGGLSFDEKGQIMLSDGASAEVVTDDETLIELGGGSTIKSAEVAAAVVSALASRVLAVEYTMTIVVGPDGGSITYPGSDEPIALRAGAVVTVSADENVLPDVTNNGSVTLKVRFQGRSDQSDANVENLTVKWIEDGKATDVGPVTTDVKGTAEIPLPK